MILSAEQINQLRAPIDAGAFAGCYLKLEGDNYRSLRNDFNQAQTSMRALTQSSLMSADLLQTNEQNWAILGERVFTALSKQTKDIELMGWLIASQVVLDPSLETLEDTLGVLNHWIDEHFEDIQPNLPDHKLNTSDAEALARERAIFKFKTLIPLLGDSEISGILHMPLQLVRFIGDISYYEYSSAIERRQEGEIQQTISERLSEEYEQICQKIMTLGCVCETLKVLDHTCAEKAGLQHVPAPNFMFLKKHIERMISLLEHIAGVTLAQLRPESLEKPDTNDQTTAKAKVSNNQRQEDTASGYTRESAYLELRHIAGFFKRTEPHSPVSYLLDKAIRWGAMPLNELLMELLKDQPETRNTVFNIAGLSDGRSPPPHEPVSQPGDDVKNAEPPQTAEPNQNSSQLW